MALMEMSTMRSVTSRMTVNTATIMENTMTNMIKKKKKKRRTQVPNQILEAPPLVTTAERAAAAVRTRMIPNRRRARRVMLRQNKMKRIRKKRPNQSKNHLSNQNLHPPPQRKSHQQQLPQLRQKTRPYLNQLKRIAKQQRITRNKRKIKDKHMHYQLLQSHPSSKTSSS